VFVESVERQCLRTKVVVDFSAMAIVDHCVRALTNGPSVRGPS
jgi:hypothetical protein